jgi:hypothetical protein
LDFYEGSNFFAGDNDCEALSYFVRSNLSTQKNRKRKGIVYVFTVIFCFNCEYEFCNDFVWKQEMIGAVMRKQRYGFRVSMTVIIVMYMSGEQIHQQGHEGEVQAKRWLESTTRARVQWKQPDPVAIPKLAFEWFHDSPVPSKDDTYSFDLGGVLKGGEQDGKEFFAEVKRYLSDNDVDKQDGFYDKYLAGCYLALKNYPARCDIFMWITWAPFRVTAWRGQNSCEHIEKSLLKFRKKIWGIDDETEARQKIKEEHNIVESLSTRLWIIVLSDEQINNLTMTQNHLSVIARYDVKHSSEGER